MPKTSISRHKLESEALKAIRGEQDCAGVKSISVTPVKIVNDGSTEWRLEVTDPGDVSPEIAYRAAHRVRERLDGQFELSDS